jgi:hypothetical protein
MLNEELTPAEGERFHCADPVLVLKSVSRLTNFA